MDIKDFQGIEASFLDYKNFLEAEKPKSWLKSVSAFANTEGRTYFNLELQINARSHRFR